MLNPLRRLTAELLQLPSIPMVKDDRQDKSGGNNFYLKGEKEDELSTELTLDELKAAFR